MHFPPRHPINMLTKIKKTTQNQIVLVFHVYKIRNLAQFQPKCTREVTLQLALERIKSCFWNKLHPEEEKVYISILFHFNEKGV